MTASLNCPSCWEFNFEYQSRNSGYGDRKDAVAASVITTHTAKVVMEGGTISSAVLDGVWDMLTQRYTDISNSPGKSEDENVRR